MYNLKRKGFEDKMQSQHIEDNQTWYRFLQSFSGS